MRNLIGILPAGFGNKRIAKYKAVFKNFGYHLDSVEAKRLLSAGPYGPVDAVVSFLKPTNRNVVSLQNRVKKTGINVRTPIFQAISANKLSALSQTKILKNVAGVLLTPVEKASAFLFIKEVNNHWRKSSQKKELIQEIFKYRGQRSRLIKIGTALSAQNNLDALLELILKESRNLLSADAGSVYIRENRNAANGAKSSDGITFKVTQNDSVQMTEKAKEFTIAIDPSTISGYVAYNKTLLNIEDVYKLPKDVPYKFGVSFDRSFNYRTKSMLTVPLKNKDGEIVGVLQLINKKFSKEDIIRREGSADKIIPFSMNDEDLIQSLASQAAVAIEKAQLYRSIENLFRGFVETSIAAIEARDHPTSGHSRRVRGYALEMAKVINEKKDGPFREVFFNRNATRELEFASILHDIGKIGVREAVLIKATRLSPLAMEVIEKRWHLAVLEDFYRNSDRNLYAQRSEEIDRDLDFLNDLNNSTFLDDEARARLDQIREKTYTDEKGNLKQSLTDEEYCNLSIIKGNLTDKERESINSHTEFTRQILSRMPWTKDLKEVVNIACHHHEKIDGTGYPDRLSDGNIPLGSRILAVIDIFEALVAQDRPYKPPMPVDKALSILRFEAKDNHIDKDILDLFINENIYNKFSSPNKDREKQPNA